MHECALVGKQKRVGLALWESANVQGGREEEEHARMCPRWEAKEGRTRTVGECERTRRNGTCSRRE